MNTKNKQPELDVEFAHFCELMARYQQLRRPPTAAQIQRAHARATRNAEAIARRFAAVLDDRRAEEKRLLSRIRRSPAPAN